jgi:putative ABC transport system permease protein
MAQLSPVPLVVETFLSDVRYAIRVLLRTPGWTAMAVLTLALGTGANTAVFGFIDALLFQPPPGVRAPAGVAAVYTSDFSSGPYGETSYPDFVAIADGVQAFERVAAEDNEQIAPVRIGNDMERVRISSVSGGYFAALGLTPTLGRGISDDDASTDAEVAVVSEAFWTRAFARDPSAIGSSIRLRDRTFTIVGVARARFRGLTLGRAIDIWTPLKPDYDAEARGNRGLDIVARLKPGATRVEAQEQLNALAARLAREFPSTNLGTLDRPREPRPMTVTAATRIPPNVRSDVMSLAAVLMGGVGLVLLLACANVASLLLSRATVRTRELAVRRALGARTGRIIRQLLTETTVLAFAAAGVGLLFAAWTADILPSFFPAEVASLLDSRLGWHVLVYLLVLAIVSSLVVGIMPALRSIRTPLAAALRGDSREVTDRAGTRMRNALVSVQVGIACVLLIGAALLVQSVGHTLGADLGFRAKDAVFASVELPSTWKSSARIAYYDEARARIGALPGVESAAWVRTPTLARTARRGFRPEGYTFSKGEDRELNINYASTGYFETLGIPLRAGRTFTTADTDTSPRVVVVNETLAKRFFQGYAVGKRMTDSSDTVLEIVGVVGDTKHITVSEPAPPLVYYPLAQNSMPRMILIARTSIPPEQLGETIRRELRGLDADVAVFATTTLREYVRQALASERLTASLVSVCGLLALALAVVGLYGAIAYLVTRRTREIGVRIALGATPDHVLMLVVRQGMWIAGAGILVGMIAAALAAQALPLGLYGVTPLDPRTYIAVMVALTLTAAIAAFVPALRAVRIDPARALTQD